MFKLGSVNGFDLDGAGRQLIKLLGFGASDVKTPTQALPHGLDSKPVKKALAVYGSTTQSGENVVIGYFLPSSDIEIGETKLFSTDSDGQEQIALHLKADGTAEFGGDADFMVRYNKLETAFNELKSDHNTLHSDFNAFVAAYNPHPHITTGTIGPTAVPGAITPTTNIATASSANSTADISPAKISEIKTS